MKKRFTDDQFMEGSRLWCREPPDCYSKSSSVAILSTVMEISSGHLLPGKYAAMA